MYWDAVSSLFTNGHEPPTYQHLSLAMAEMNTLLAVLYQKYTTEPRSDFGVVSPGITSRFEVFYDEGCIDMRVCVTPGRVDLRSSWFRNMIARLNLSRSDLICPLARWIARLLDSVRSRQFYGRSNS